MDDGVGLPVTKAGIGTKAGKDSNVVDGTKTDRGPSRDTWNRAPGGISPGLVQPAGCDHGVRA